jgi:hypothetical protein
MDTADARRPAQADFVVVGLRPGVGLIAAR